MKREKTPTGDAKNAAHEELTLLNRNHKEYPDAPEKAKLEAFVNRYPEHDYVIEFDCPEFTSLCPVTGQPDFGHIKVRYFAFRSHNSFHEEVVNRILVDLVKLLSPRWMRVEGVFRPRGGIAISVAAEDGTNPELAPKVEKPIQLT